MPTKIALGQLRPIAQMPKKYQTWAIRLRRFFAKRVRLISWGYSKSGMVGCETKYHLTSPVEPQNPSNSPDIACTSKMKREKELRKKNRREEKESSDEGFGWYITGRPRSGVFWPRLRSRDGTGQDFFDPTRLLNFKIIAGRPAARPLFYRRFLFTVKCI